MNPYLVSARKYRPQNFKTVVGQSHITTTLKNAILNKQLAHAFLFCGPRGVGKTTCARILAKTINCQNLTSEGEACNTCDNCLQFEKGTSFNVHELDAASNNKSEDIRELIEQVRYAPPSGKYKVYIIDEVHMLSTSAFNVFLKTLEEPPPHAIFILATTEKHKIIPTILSRCQIFDFKRIVASDTVKQLTEITEKEHIEATPDALELIAHKTEGCMRDALSLLDKIVSFTNGKLTYDNTLEHLNILDEQSFFEVLDFLKNEQINEALLWYDSIFKKGFEGSTIIQVFQSFLRNILVSKQVSTLALLDVLESSKEKYQHVAAHTDQFYILSLLQILQESDIQYRDAVNKRLHVEMLIIKLCYVKQTLESFQDSPQGVELVRKGDRPSLMRIQPIIKTYRWYKPPPTIDKLLTNVDIINPAITQPIPNIVTPTPSSKIVSIPTFNTTSKTTQNKTIIDIIKDQYNDLKILPIEQIIELDLETLKNYWECYLETIKTNNTTAWTQFKLLDFEIIDSQKFLVIFPSQIVKTYFDQAKLDIMSFLKTSFKNNGLSYDFKILPKPIENSTLTNASGFNNTKDNYLKLVEEYPLIDELRQKLKLELR